MNETRLVKQHVWQNTLHERFVYILTRQSQKELHRTKNGRAKSVQDDEDGHLIYRHGDWLQARCTKRRFMLVLIV